MAAACGPRPAGRAPAAAKSGRRPLVTRDRRCCRQCCQRPVVGPAPPGPARRHTPKQAGLCTGPGCHSDELRVTPARLGAAAPPYHGPGPPLPRRWRVRVTPARRRSDLPADSAEPGRPSSSRRNIMIVSRSQSPCPTRTCDSDGRDSSRGPGVRPAAASVTVFAGLPQRVPAKGFKSNNHCRHCHDHDPTVTVVGTGGKAAARRVRRSTESR